jgi:hypothetical protein
VTQEDLSMTKRLSIGVCIVVLALALTPMNAPAVIVEHVFTGQVTEQSVLFPQVQIGDPFTAPLRFDTAEVPGVIGSSAFYTDFTFEVTLDGLVFPRDPLTALVVENDALLGDRFVIDGIGIGQAGFALEDPSATAFDSFALPTVLDLADFTLRQIIVVTGVDFIRGEITSVSTSVAVPEPSSVLLLVTSAVAWLSIPVTLRLSRR